MGVIIQGSSRKDGNTSKIANLLNDGLGFERIDLCEKDIGHFDYEFRNSSDDYRPLMKHIIESHDIILFATPVYWYSMSGLMKNFFDRFTDLLRTEKELGRNLRGKSTAMISCGSDDISADYFKMPFVETAGYLGMNYLGDLHTWFEGDGIPEVVKKRIAEFAEKLRS